MSELKERVRAQYQRMHALLEANQAETVQMLENTFTVYVRKNSQQVLQLNERRQQAEKLLSSVQTFFQRSESINFMKVRICTSLSMSPTPDYVCAAVETHTQRYTNGKCLTAYTVCTERPQQARCLLSSKELMVRC